MFPFFLALYNDSQVSIVALWATCSFKDGRTITIGRITVISIFVIFLVSWDLLRPVYKHN